jgi:ABC-type transport system involved in multi-copper enzyme maturation permease subunit
MSRLFHLVRSDLLERTRRFSFLILLAATVGAGYLFVPPVDAGYRVLQVGVQRGIYNSPWVGLMFGLIAALLLPLLGFYLIKNTVERDRHTGVGEIIATTPMSKLNYVLGKWFSNIVFLSLILVVMTMMAMIMQYVRAEERTVDLIKLAGPIWLMGFPVLAITSAIAVFFECTSFLRSGFGFLLPLAYDIGYRFRGCDRPNHRFSQTNQ